MSAAPFRPERIERLLGYVRGWATTELLTGLLAHPDLLSCLGHPARYVEYRGSAITCAAVGVGLSGRQTAASPSIVARKVKSSAPAGRHRTSSTRTFHHGRRTRRRARAAQGGQRVGAEPQMCGRTESAGAAVMCSPLAA